MTGQSVSTDWDNLTALIRLSGTGTPEAQSQLFELLYSDLRRMAAARLRDEKSRQTLTATALVHEVYLRLAGGAALTCRDQGHFLAMAAQAMRRILVDQARARAAGKRGGQLLRVEVEGVAAADAQPDTELLAVDGALAALGELSPRQCRVVELRYFGGLTEDQVAEALGVNRRTVNRDWRMARAWLHAYLSSSSSQQ